MAIFQIYGGSANDEVAAFGNGLTLAVVSKAFLYTSTFYPKLCANSALKSDIEKCTMPCVLENGVLTHATTMLQSMQQQMCLAGT